MSKKIVFAVLGGGALCVALVLLWVLQWSGAMDVVVSQVDAVRAFLEGGIDPGLFLLLMALLPVLGFPFSVFLVLAGVKFGAFGGMLATACVLPVHMSLCFVLARFCVRTPLLRFLERRGYHPALMHVERPRLFLVAFLLFPGPPYILKTYILALTGLPFRYFLPLNFATESVITLPIAALGGAAAEEKWGVFSLFLFLFVVLSLVLRWWKKARETKRD